MRTRTDFPRRVREIENEWIPLGDGTRLAAKIWLPEDAEADPVPAILEYLPYRKRDWTARRDSVRHPYVAGHGYAVVRVDIRGTGDSDGILLDEYLTQEQDDALEVLAWLAAQPWCTGSLGMFGISWGGFNGLQVAARRPGGLKAIITVGSTDDRYSDDVHYNGGCVLAIDMLPWSAAMLVWNATPPDPEIVGERWRERWLERIERTPPFGDAWLTHQRRDAYWKQGSVCEDYGAIEAAVYAVGGWADGYPNAVPRLLEGLSCPRKGLVGPWAHTFPEEGVPGPAIGFLQEAVRWWDHWLKGEGNGVMDEPMLTAWMEDWVHPSPSLMERPGRWVTEEAWPSPRLEDRIFYLADGGLVDEPSDELPLVTASPGATGLDSGLWGAWGGALDLPPDQRADDGLSRSFTSTPLSEPLELLGFPDLRLALSSDRPRALLAARLCDVAPDGTSAIVCRGMLNLTHRDSHEHAEPLEPGRRYDVRVTLDAIAHTFRPGHRIRLSLSPAYWPWLWPSPEQVNLTVFTGPATTLSLPVRPRPPDDETQPFGEAETAEPLAIEQLTEVETERAIRRDLASGTVVLTYRHGAGRRRLPNHTELDDESVEIFTITEDDPLSARVRVDNRVAIARHEWQTRIETVSEMWSDAEAFHVTNELAAFEGEEQVAERRWSFSTPRDLV